MGIKFEWLNHAPWQKNKAGGIARFKVGEQYHHIHVASMATALELHKLLQHAHAAGEKSGKEHSMQEERQRVSDLLLG